MTSQSLVGATGIVQIRVRGGEHAGEVRVVVQGLAHQLPGLLSLRCRGGTAGRGDQQSRRASVDVEPWPMTDVGLGAASRVD